jgi:hypothetical protein
MVAMRRRRLHIPGLFEALILSLLLLLEVFRRSPRPSSSPLVSGTAPADDQNGRPLSKDQLNQLESWLRQHKDGWRRNIIPPVSPCYMVDVEHSDGMGMLVYLFERAESNAYFSKGIKGRGFDAGWLSLPAAEVDGLATMLRKEA